MSEAVLSPRRSLVEGWLGVDPVILAIAAGYLAARSVLAEGLTIEGVRGTTGLAWSLWVFAIGVNGIGVVLLGAWLVCGPGRLAARAVWLVCLGWLNWIVFTRYGSRGNQADYGFSVAVDLNAFVLVLVVAGILYRFRGWRLRPRQDQGMERRWQFGVADLLLWTLVAALIVIARDHLWGAREHFTTFDPTFNPIHGARCGSALCVMIGLAGLRLLLTDRPRVGWFLVLSTLAVGLAMLAARGPLAQPIFTTVQYAPRYYVPGGLGATFAALATLLPLRAYGWRLSVTAQHAAAR